MEIRAPATPKEFEQYYDLRYRLLREPWGHPRGSEQDESDKSGVHIGVYNNGTLLGVAQLTQNSTNEGQARYVAVEKSAQGRGIGKLLMNELERQAQEKGMTKIVLNARDTAIAFYEKCGYQTIGEARPSRYPTVPHMRMQKNF